MNEAEARHLLHRAADGIPTGHTSTADLLHRGQRRLRQRRGFQGLAALGALTLLISGGLALHSPDRTVGPQVVNSPRPSATDVRAQSTTVPVLQDMSRHAAERRLRSVGLRARVMTAPARCVPPGSVLSQEPRAGRRLPEGSVVALVVAVEPSPTPRCPAGIATRTDRSIARNFYEFAESVAQDPAPPAPEVSLGLGYQIIRRYDGEGHPRSWRLPGPFAGRTGPFSVLDVVAGSDGTYRLLVGRHPRCVGPPIAPSPELTGLRQLSIQPRSWETCLQWWSVDLFINDVGQIQAITLDYWDP